MRESRVGAQRLEAEIGVAECKARSGFDRAIGIDGVAVVAEGDDGRKAIVVGSAK